MRHVRTVKSRKEYHLPLSNISALLLENNSIPSFS